MATVTNIARERSKDWATRKVTINVQIEVPFYEYTTEELNQRAEDQILAAVDDVMVNSDLEFITMEVERDEDYYPDCPDPDDDIYHPDCSQKTTIKISKE